MDTALPTTARTTGSEVRRALALAAAIAVVALVVTTAWGFVYDDTWISLRYAAMFAETGVLEWNPGERVEGYTNFLFTVMLGSLLKLGLDPLFAARLVSGFGLLLTVTGAVAVVRILLPNDAEARAIAVLGTLGTIALPLWTLGGMEAPLVAGLVTWAIWGFLPIATDTASAGRLALGTALFSLAYLTRMDAVVPIVAVLGAAVLFGSGSFIRRFSHAGMVTTGTLAVVALHLWWRFQTYGEFLPNTYYAKVGVDLGHRLDFGLFYLRQSLIEAPLLALALLLSPVAILHLPRMALIILAPVAAQIAYVLWSGGDHLPVGRFLVVVLGAAAVLFSIGYAALGAVARTGALAAAIVAAGWAAVTVPPPFHGGAEAGTIVGRWIDANVPEDQVIAINTAGAAPFHAPRHRFIDMLGLNDAHIARVADLPMTTEYQRRPGHAKGDGAYVLRRAPDIIIAGYADGLPIGESPFLGDQQLAASAEFARCYVQRQVPIDAAGNAWMRASGRGETLTLTYYQRRC